MIKWRNFSYIMIFFVLTTIFVTPVIAEDFTDTTHEIKLIPLDSSKIKDDVIAFYSSYYITKASALVDEQQNVPTLPTMQLAQKLSLKDWVPTMQDAYKPISAYIDLGTTYKITHIAYYDLFGTPIMEFSQGSPFHWNNIFTTVLDTFENWVVRPVENVETRYIQIKSPNSCDSGISEIALYGYQVGADPIIDNSPEPPKPDFGITVDESIGINAFIDDPLDKMKVAGHVREYHSFCWDGESADGTTFSPGNGGKWDYDAYYKGLKDAGVNVFPCIQGNANWILGNGLEYDSPNNKPIARNMDASNPQSYIEHASRMFQYAARYGSTKVDESRLKLAVGQEKKSGLGYINYFENSNEQNKDWEGKESYFSPYEFAAMCSADYDGHEGTMGADIGIKNADPNAKLVMGGLAGMDFAIEYFERMKLWFENSRTDKKFVPDVLNFHTYCGRKSPEDANFKDTLSKLVKWRNKNLPDKELWMTEFGWDTNTASENAAPTFEAQAQWLVRGYLAAIAAGIDKSTMYMLRDVAPWDPWVYSSSGLVDRVELWTPKPSWYYVYTMKDTLKGMVFDRIITESENLYIYKFVSADKNFSKECYVLWCPTSNGTTIENYSLDIGENRNANLVELKEGFNDGVKSNLVADYGKISVNVSETPTFVVTSENSQKYLEPTYKKIPISTANMHCENPLVVERFSHFFDEQDTATIAPTAVLKGTFKTMFDDIWPQTSFPYSCYIDLGGNYKITHIGFFDSTSDGRIKFYKGTPNNWETTPCLEYGLPVYNMWQVKEAGFEARYLKIEKYDNADLYEIAFYGYSMDGNVKITPHFKNGVIDSVTVSNESSFDINSATLIVAEYDNATNKLLKCKIFPNSSTTYPSWQTSDIATNYQLESAPMQTNIKMFLWDNINGIRPLSNYGKP